MCEFLNEPNSTYEFLTARIAKLEDELEECKLSSIEYRNPGIDIEEIRRTRAEQKEAMKDI